MSALQDQADREAMETYRTVQSWREPTRSPFDRLRDPESADGETWFHLALVGLGGLVFGLAGAVVGTWLQVL